MSTGYHQICHKLSEIKHVALKPPRCHPRTYVRKLLIQSVDYHFSWFIAKNLAVTAKDIWTQPTKPNFSSLLNLNFLGFSPNIEMISQISPHDFLITVISIYLE